MNFSEPLVAGTLIKRYKRFLADVSLPDGSVVTAHCANTGSMKTCGAPGDTVWLLHAPAPGKKLAWAWELTSCPTGGFIGINTSRPNRVVEEAVRAGAIPELTGYDTVRREVAYGNKSKIDLLLQTSDHSRPDCYVEIKNVTLRHGDAVQFPDAVTERGLKHLQELTAMVRAGHRAVLFFFVNRPDGDYVTAAAHIDHAYASGLEEAIAAGVEVLAYRSHTSATGISLGSPIPFHRRLT